MKGVLVARGLKPRGRQELEAYMNGRGGSGFIRKRLEAVRRLWGGIAGEDYGEEAAELRPHLPPEDMPRLLAKMRECLDSGGGEIRARSRAAALGRAYLALNAQGRKNFLKTLATEFDTGESEVLEAMEGWRSAADPQARRKARRALRAAIESPRSRILTRFNALPQGVKFLVDLRSDLLPLAKGDAALGSLDDDLKVLLVSWFDPGFLELKRISWDTASGALLEKFMAYEAVHPVEDWTDLKDRLDYDRRYFAFFHPRMPGEPLIFLEVALVNELAVCIQKLLDPQAPTTDPDKADTAIFYSISNAQKGLAGVSFGGFLIKRVVEELAREFPGLKTFATLSPLPGFRGWLETGDPPLSDLLLPSERKKIHKRSPDSDPGEWLLEVVREAGWLKNPEVENVASPILLRLAARYLALEKKDGRRALDSVAHFHLSNGARLERLNWAGDLSEKGVAQSSCIMVNYLYDSRKIDTHHEAYCGQGRVSISPGIRTILKG